MKNVKQSLVKISIQILRPLIRILLRNGVSHSEFVEIAKRAYVDVAFQDFPIPGKPKTISHAAVITGLSRKEVLRIRNVEENESVEKGPINRAARVINGWLSDSEFLNSRNKPKPLPIKGDESSFEALVKRYSGDITWGAVLNELQRVNAVAVDEKNNVKLQSTGYVPQADEQQKMVIMGDCATDLFETFSHNLEPERKPRFQRSMAYAYLSQETVDEFEELACEKSNQLLIELNAWLVARNTPVSERKKLHMYQRAGIGIYYFNNPAGGKQYEEKSEEN